MIRRPARHARQRSFTLVELLAVIIIFAIVVAIAVPAFNALLYTSNQSRAANSLEVALASARDAAISARPGSDGAAVFFYDPGQGITVVPCVEVGVLRDRDPDFPNSVNAFVEREVFAPAAGIEPVQLPDGWMVRAFVPPGAIHKNPVRPTGWYDLGDGSDSDSEQYTMQDEEAHWIAPETGRYARHSFESGRARQTFMVRFEGGTGRLDLASTEPVLVFDPAPRDQTLLANIPPALKDYRPELATSLQRYVRAVLAAPPQGLGIGGGGGGGGVQRLSLEQKRRMLGDESADTVLTRPVGQVTVYNARRMASAIGARAVNNETGTIFLPQPVDPNALEDPTTHTEIDVALFDGLGADEITDRVRRWVEDRYPDDSEDRTRSDARIFGVRRYDGAVIELTGSKTQI